MGGMYLHHFKTCCKRASCGFREIVYALPYILGCHFPRCWLIGMVSNRARCNGFPCALNRRKCFIAFPRALVTCFSACMCELYTWHSALAFHKSGNPA